MSAQAASLPGAVSGGRRRGRGAGAQDQDFELNLASIIDCLVVLIAFVLVSTAFVSIGILDAGVAAGGAEAKSATLPSVTVTIELTGDRAIALKVSGKAKSSSVLAAREGELDYRSLERELGALKGKWPDLSGATLVAENSVAYRDVVKSMEVARRTLPAILLGGF